ncbi:MAG: biopolymer transporter ExbD [Myxococcales bacterium]|nr:biopolymer transporter ExbD [Myxococcales bacterium]
MASLSRKGRSGRPTPQMNVTPLVDVVLVLLIIFMIVIPAMTEGVNLEVPAVANVDEEAEDEGPEPVMISVNRHGVIFIDDLAVPEGELTAQLTNAHRRNPRSRLVLRGDRGVTYAQVRDLYAAAQAVGFPGVSLRVNRDDARAE